MCSFNCLINLDVGIYIQIKTRFSVVGLCYSYRLAVEHVFSQTFSSLHGNIEKYLSVECRLTKWQSLFGLSLVLSVNSRSCGRFGVVVPRAQQS